MYCAEVRPEQATETKAAAKRLFMAGTPLTGQNSQADGACVGIFQAYTVLTKQRQPKQGWTNESRASKEV